MMFMALNTLPCGIFSLCGIIINVREKRGEEIESHARHGFNTKSKTLDTIKFVLGKSSVFMIRAGHPVLCSFTNSVPGK